MTSQQTNKKIQIGILSDEENEYPVYKGINYMGRDPRCDIHLIHSTVSKKHAQICANEKIVFIRDIMSCNGTAINDMALRPGRMYQILDGNVIKCGDVCLTYKAFQSSSLKETENSALLSSVAKSTMNCNTTINSSDILSNSTVLLDATNNNVRVPSLPSQDEVNESNSMSNDLTHGSIQEQETQTCSQYYKKNITINREIQQQPKSNLHAIVNLEKKSNTFNKTSEYHGIDKHTNDNIHDSEPDINDDDMFQCDTLQLSSDVSETMKRPGTIQNIIQVNVKDGLRKQCSMAVNKESVNSDNKNTCVDMHQNDSYNLVDSLNRKRENLKSSKVDFQSSSKIVGDVEDVSDVSMSCMVTQRQQDKHSIIDETIYECSTQQLNEEEEEDIFCAATQLNRKSPGKDDDDSDTDPEGVFETLSQATNFEMLPLDEKESDSRMTKNNDITQNINRSDANEDDIDKENLSQLPTQVAVFSVSQSRTQTIEASTDSEVYMEATQQLRKAVSDENVDIFNESDDNISNAGDTSLAITSSIRNLADDECSATNIQSSTKRNANKKDVHSISEYNDSCDLEYQMIAKQAIKEIEIFKQKGGKDVMEKITSNLHSGSYLGAHDVIEENLRKIFGAEDNNEHTESSQLMTQQLENVLQSTIIERDHEKLESSSPNLPTIRKKIISPKISKSVSSQNSVILNSTLEQNEDSDSQRYFANLKTRRKRNIMVDTQDSEDESRTFSKRAKESEDGKEENIKKQISSGFLEGARNIENSKTVNDCDTAIKTSTPVKKSVNKMHIVDKKCIEDMKKPFVLLRREGSIDSLVKTNICTKMVEEEAAEFNDFQTSSIDKDGTEFSKSLLDCKKDILSDLPPINVSNTLSNPTDCQSDQYSNEAILSQSYSPKKKTPVKLLVEISKQKKSLSSVLSEKSNPPKLDNITISDSEDDERFKEFKKLCDKILQVKSTSTNLRSENDCETVYSASHPETSFQVSNDSNKSTTNSVRTSSPRMMTLSIERSKKSSSQEVLPIRKIDRNIEQHVEKKILSVDLCPVLVDVEKSTENNGNLESESQLKNEKQKPKNRKEISPSTSCIEGLLDVSNKSPTHRVVDENSIKSNKLKKNNISINESLPTIRNTLLRSRKDTDETIDNESKVKESADLDVLKNFPVTRSTRNRRLTDQSSNNESKVQEPEESFAKKRSTCTRVTRRNTIKVEEKAIKRTISDNTITDTSNLGDESQEIQSILDNTNIVSPKRLKTESNELKTQKRQTISESVKRRVKKVAVNQKVLNSTLSHEHHMKHDGKLETTLTSLNDTCISSPTTRKTALNISISPSRRFRHKILFTGIKAEKWRKTLSQLGASEATDVINCTVLVTDKVRRTVKFLCTLARGKPILSVKWLEDSNAAGHFLDCQDYILHDTDAEATFDFQLKKSLEMANESSIFKDWTIILTSTIEKSLLTDLKELVKAGEGKVSLSIPRRCPKNMVIVSNKNDINSVKMFVSQVPKTVTVQSTEFIFSGILKQKLDFEKYMIK